MPIEYEDLIEQLTQFRLNVIKALGDIDVELDALSRAVTGKQPVLPETLNRLRDKSRERLKKFQEVHERQIPLLHEKR